MRILAIDPGPHVGIATWEDGEFRSQETNPDVLYSFIAKWIEWADFVVIENFIIKGSRASEANATIEMIGVVRYVCQKIVGRPLTLQAPADAMAFSTREKLERIGWWHRGGSDHARAASKHLLLYCVKNGCIDAKDVLG